MDCCQPGVIDARFDREYVIRKIRRYQERGPKETTRLLISAIEARLTPDMRLLDIGGGLGDIEHALLQKGMLEAVNVEASAAYLEGCKQEAARLGHADRIQYVNADFTAVSEEIASADIVTLDRVICCYPSMDLLVSESLAKSTNLYGIVIPIDRWWVKIFTSIFYNLRFWIQGNPFRVYVHPVNEIEAHIMSSNFTRLYAEKRSGWQVALYQRSN